jgi:hypothetical protein
VALNLNSKMQRNVPKTVWQFNFFRETSEEQSRKKKIYLVRMFLTKIKPVLLLLFIAGKLFS